MLSKGGIKYNITHDGKVVLAIDDPVNKLLNDGFEWSEQVKQDTFKEAERLVGKHDTIESYKEALEKLGTKESIIVLKLMKTFKRQTKVNGHYYNEFDMTVAEPDMIICDVIAICGLDTLLKQVPKRDDLSDETKGKIQKLESKKEKIVKGGYTMREKPGHITKYNKYNKELLKLYSS